MSETPNVLNTKLCPKCGFENDANYKFCMKCGTQLTSKPIETPKTNPAGFKTTSQPTPPDSSAPKQPSRRIPKGLEIGRNRARRRIQNISQQVQDNQQGMEEVSAFRSSINNQQTDIKLKPATQATPENESKNKPSFNSPDQNKGSFGSSQSKRSEQTVAFKQTQNKPTQTNSQNPKSVVEIFKEQQNKKQTQGFASTQKGASTRSRKRSPVSFNGIIEPVEVDTSHIEEVFAKGLPEWDVTPPFIVVRRKKK